MTAVAVPVLAVSNLARSVVFYETLGFVPIVESEGRAILVFQGAETQLVQVDGLPRAAKNAAGAYLRVHDADAVHAQWTRVGGIALDPPVDGPHGLREFTTVDLDGNHWTVGSLGPAVPPRPGAADHTSGTSDAPVDGSPGTTDGAWLAIVESATCAGCGLTASAGATGVIGGRIIEAAHRWQSLLDGDEATLRRRPDPSTWSALEYAVHVRDVLRVFDERIARMLVENDPDLGWWDHETAIEHANVNDIAISSVSEDLMRNAAELRGTLQKVAGAAWLRTGTRRSGERMTIETAARFALHEVIHHRVDAEQSAQTD